MAKVKKQCGDFGGLNRFNEPCGRPAGWRTPHKGKGNCALHEGAKGSRVRTAIPEKYSAKPKAAARRKEKIAAGEKMRPGAPGLYTEDHPAQAFKFCLLGCRDVDLADLFEVTVKTIGEWKVQYPEFREAILAGREEADANVVNAMYESALGFEHDEEKIMQHEGSVIRADTRKKYPPNIAAATLWLLNRQKQRWRDQRRVEVSGSLTLDMKELTDEELLVRVHERQARFRAITGVDPHVSAHSRN